MNSENRTVYGFLSYPTTSPEGQPPLTRGMIHCCFEQIKGDIYPINQEVFFDERKLCYLYDGYKDILSKVGKRLVRFEAVKNINYESDNSNHTLNVTFKRNMRDNFNTDCFYSIIDHPLPEPFDMKNVELPNYPLTNVFFFRVGEYIYGPFVALPSSEAKADLVSSGIQQTHTVKFDLMTQTMARVLNIPNIPFGYIAKIKLTDLVEYLDGKSDSCHAEADGSFVFYDKQRLAGVKAEKVCYLSQTNVLAVLEEVTSNRVVGKPSINALKTHLNSISKTLTPEVKDALEAYFNRAGNTEEEHEAMIALLRGTTHGKQIIEDYLKKEREAYLSNWAVEAEKKQKSIANQIGKLKSEKDDLAHAIETTRHELNILESEIDEKAEILKSELSDELMAEAKKKAQLDHDEAIKRLQETTAVLNKKHGRVIEIDSIIDQHEVWVAKNKRLIEEIEEKRRAVDILDMELLKRGDEMRKSIVPLLPVMSAFGIKTKRDSAEADYPLLPKRTVLHDECDRASGLEYASKVVNSIARKFSENHEHNYSNEFIASALVAMNQSLISIFVGPPGSGKSSFMRILERIIRQEDRFLEIGVARGWSGERDFIGYYNSITEKFAPAASGFYSYMRGIEDDKLDDSAPHTVLLDEANLSAIEHYGSSILKMADTESNKEIFVHDRAIPLPADINFVATVNIDPTTEALSPRLLDRAPVIPFELFIDQEPNYSDQEVEWPLSAGLMKSIFGENSVLSELDEERLPPKLVALIEQMGANDPDKGLPIYVSPRKKQRALRYFSVLERVLRVSTDMDAATSLKVALDFTALYFFLPTIFVSGTQGRKRLEAIKHVLDENEMSLSSSKVADMISRGEYNFDMYSYMQY